MPKKEEHIDWAIHDRNFLTSINLENTPFTDWAVTGMFYESLHWVETFLSTKGHQYRKHYQREQAMRLLYPSDLAAIEADYTKLKQDSEAARYDCYKHTAEAQQFIPLADNIKSHISQLL